MSGSHGAWSWDFGGPAGSRRLQGVKKLNHRLGGQVLVVVVVYLHHRRVDAGSETFDFEDCEETIFGGLAVCEAQVLGDGLPDLVTAATTKLAWSLDGISELASATKLDPKSHSNHRVAALTVVQAATKNLPTGFLLYIV